MGDMGLSLAFGGAAAGDEIKRILADQYQRTLDAQKFALEQENQKRLGEGLQLQKDAFGLQKDRAIEQSDTEAFNRKQGSLAPVVPDNAPPVDGTTNIFRLPGAQPLAPMQIRRVGGATDTATPESFQQIDEAKYQSDVNKPRVLNLGDKFVGRGGETLADNPRPEPAAPKQTELEQYMNASPEERARMEAGIHAIAQAGAKPPTSEKLIAVKGPDGSSILVPQSQAAGMEQASVKRAPIGLERTSLGYYNRMATAIDSMDVLEPSLDSKDLFLIHNAPLGELANNLLLSDKGRQYVQALRTYTEARLRKESGAAIPESEFANDRRMVAAAPGDDPTTIANKKHTRQITADTIGFAAGPAFEEYYGVPFKRGSRPTSGGGDTDKSVTSAELQALATLHGTTVDQEKQRATASGYVIR